MEVKKYGELLKRHSVLFENFTYISILQIFVILAPLLTYPYLVRVLGSDLGTDCCELWFHIGGFWF